ncbi:MAG: CotS family spore coat protein [Clostridium argentinense]|uniref:CotS family spore coat protein n=1 Tax=Clostridium faecium TaxID=2762223 RepID=A0ABR8YY43_9CLOT|nr:MULTISPECIES: CotS family spore coat protein [Clostridium]MBD8048836.1 CotS family spore coat protein [Clostridium faecium]MBS5823960.1 CotS family spore coat protein [Clostridium argentinense]MDU1348319.1 CotS family spore coat protein [Clostridium argentinense]
MMTTATIYKNNIELLSEKNVKKHVLPHYNLNNAIVKQVKLKNTEKQRAVYMIEDYENKYCLKKVYYPVEELLFVYSAIEWLYRHNINVPRILSTTNHGRYVIYENMLFILTPWVEGYKCDFDSIYEILLASSNLGKVHHIGKNFKPILGSKNKIGCSSLYNSINKHFNNLLIYSNLAYKYHDNYSKIYLKNFDTNINLAKISNSIAATIKEENLTTSLCHNDYVSKNLIVDENDNLWLIDFDKCKVDYCALDISYCLRRLLRKEKNKWSLNLTIKFLNIYEKHNPLTFDDYKYILAYLSFPQKYWKISRDYYANISKCNRKAFVSMLKKSNIYLEYQLRFSLGFKDYIEERFNEKF